MEESLIDIQRKKRVKEKEKSPITGFVFGIFWAWNTLFILFMWFLTSTIIEAVKPYSIWEVGGIYYQSFQNELFTLIFASIGLISSLAVYFFKIKFAFIGIFIACIGFITIKVNEILEINQLGSTGTFILWIIVPFLFLVYFLINFLKSIEKKDKNDLF